ncbi:hypothetical protein AVEN_172212-1 [Araneus ventricosus]|uniref:Uncharacterized protein n=1 Tax=Araneus ventricosus TaxID=182803 RepID=A0A4Y2W6T6_ARAVE|nr:hypothetical protein AVEN_172212-1 [Araneus ventricosus]
MELEVDNKNIDKLVEEHSQELTSAYVAHCVLQQEVMEESLTKKEVIAKQESSTVIRETLKEWETVASYIEKHYTNKAVAMGATNVFYDNAMSHFRQIFKRRLKQMSLDSFLIKKELGKYHNSIKNQQIY